MIVDRNPQAIDSVSQLKILNSCENKPVELDSLTSGVVSDIPIILANHKVSFYNNFLIKLPHEAIKVTVIKNKLTITNYVFLQESNVLFIEGFIRKSVYYSPASLMSNNNLKYCMVYVPFKCSTNINLNYPQVSSNANKASAKLAIHKATKSNLTTQSKNFFHTKPFCQLVCYRITEHCKYIYSQDKTFASKAIGTKNIIELKDNMSINLQVQILQNHKVYISPYSTGEKYIDMRYDDSCLKNRLSSVSKLNSDNKPNEFNSIDIPDSSYKSKAVSSINNLDSGSNFSKLPLISLLNSNDKSKEHFYKPQSNYYRNSFLNSHYPPRHNSLTLFICILIIVNLNS